MGLFLYELQTQQGQVPNPVLSITALKAAPRLWMDSAKTLNPTLAFNTAQPVLVYVPFPPKPGCKMLARMAGTSYSSAWEPG